MWTLASSTASSCVRSATTRHVLTGPVIKLEMTYRDAAGEHSRQYEIAKDSNLHGNLVTTRPAAILVAA